MLTIFGHLTAKRINQAPKAVISSPSHQIKLPNSGVIIDGSASTDDDGIESYHWEMVTVPLGYNPPDKSGPTLQLTDLIPGNYTIMYGIPVTFYLCGYSLSYSSLEILFIISVV